MRGAGRATFAAVLLLIAGTLNIIYGIGALDSANIYANDTRYIFTNLNTMGWVLIVLGADPAHRRLLAARRQHLRAGDRHRRRQPRCDRGPAFDRRRQSVVVARHLRPVHLHPPRHPRARGRRARAGPERRGRADGGSLQSDRPRSAEDLSDAGRRPTSNRERVLRTLTFWLRPEFVLRVVNRFQKVAGFDRSIALASAALTATIPLMIVTSAVASQLGGKGTADRIIDRYELTGGGAEAVRDVFSPPTGTSTSLGIVGFLFLMVAVLSFSRAVQRLFEQTWELKPAERPQHLQRAALDRRAGGLPRRSAARSTPRWGAAASS